MVRYCFLGLTLLLASCSIFVDPVLHGQTPTLGEEIVAPSGWRNGYDGYCDRNQNDVQCKEKRL